MLGTLNCSKESDSDTTKIQHSLQVRFVDPEGNNWFNNQNYNDEAIRVVTYDDQGVEHDFFDPDWFAMHGYTVDRFYDRYIFTIYFTLPEPGGDFTTETFVRLFGNEPDIFTVEYEVREGKTPDEPYYGGTVKIKTVHLNGDLIWDVKSSPEIPVNIIREFPAGPTE